MVIRETRRLFSMGRLSMQLRRSANWSSIWRCIGPTYGFLFLETVCNFFHRDSALLSRGIFGYLCALLVIW